MDKELVKLKGTGDGIKIYLDAESSIADLTNSLYDKLRKFRKFFGGGHSNIYITGRELDVSDKIRLEAIVTAMMPESVVNYGDGRRLRDDSVTEKTLELPDILKEDGDTSDDGVDEDIEKIMEVITSNYKSSRARFFEGVVRAGKKVESDGHLVLVGNVEKGGRLEAQGNVVVFGRLSGSVHAGKRGIDKAYVLALECEPEDIRISTARARFEKSDFDGSALKAYLYDNRIVAEKFILKNIDKI